MARRRPDLIDTMPAWEPTDLVRLDTGASCRGMVLPQAFDFALPDTWADVERDVLVEEVEEVPTDNPKVTTKVVKRSRQRRMVREVVHRGGCVRGPAMSWLVELDGGGFCVLPRESCMGREAFEAARKAAEAREIAKNFPSPSEPRAVVHVGPLDPVAFDDARRGVSLPDVSGAPPVAPAPAIG